MGGASPLNEEFPAHQGPKSFFVFFDNVRTPYSKTLFWELSASEYGLDGVDLLDCDGTKKIEWCVPMLHLSSACFAFCVQIATQQVHLKGG